MEDLIALQIQREKEAEAKAESKYYKNLVDAINQGRFDDTREGQALLKSIYIPIRTKVIEYLDTNFRGHTEQTKNFIKLLSDDPDEITYTLLTTLIRQISQSNNRAHLTSIANSITKQLKRLNYFSRLQKDNPKLHTFLGREYRRASAKRKEMLIEKKIKSLLALEDNDNDVSNIKVGTALVELVLLSGTEIIKMTRQHTKKKRAAYFVSFTDDVIEILYDINHRVLPNPTMSPMIVPPTDWNGFKEGGYLHYKLSFVKARTRKARSYLNEQDFSKIYPIINKLQKTAWRINKRVADVVYDIFDGNMIDPTSPKELPRCYGNIPTPNSIKAEDIVGHRAYKKLETAEEKQDFHTWYEKKKQIQINLDGEVGRRLQFILTLNMVQEMIDFERFYYVYQLDYRGRVYPTTDFLNPQAKGYTKAMLEFSDGDYLNERGVYWLKIHIANCYGLDKEPFDVRIKWVEDNVHNIVQVAKNPMECLKYWTDADSPYEYLAGCYAWLDYTEGKKVHLPIQLDAVNSGVQFYSGLLLDKEGAESCCVIGNVRSDLYQKVADKVNDKLINNEYPKLLHFKDGDGVERSVGTRVEADSLKGKVTRSMTKTNVMTVPYSVTIRGMQDQNWNVMDKMNLEGKSFWKGDPWVVNRLLTELNYDSIYEVVNGAKQGQDYLRKAAEGLTEPAAWYTPLYNFPVLQPSFKRKEMRVQTPLGRLSIQIGLDTVDKNKQLSSIAANYIHSIDSTLLLYCVKHMSSDIGVIHDCYLVHANNGDEIVNHYKEGYIEIMSSKPLEQFSKQLDPEGLVEIPCIGTLNLEEVRDSMYIIS